MGTQLGAEMLTAKPWWGTWPGHSEEGLVFGFRGKNPTRVPPARPIAAGPPFQPRQPLRVTTGKCVPRHIAP